MFNENAMYPTLPAKDLERAKDWYAEKLDLKPIDEGWGGYMYETREGARFYIYPSESAGTNEATAGAFFEMGDEFDDAISQLRNRGVEFMEFDYDGMSTDNGVMTDPSGERAAWFEDSEGNILAISTQ
jgi:catechol 2,3-dioxygenase-like lactoylglutathione lyase family enzyme